MDKDKLNDILISTDNKSLKKSIEQKKAIIDNDNIVLK